LEDVDASVEEFDSETVEGGCPGAGLMHRGCRANTVHMHKSDVE